MLLYQNQSKVEWVKSEATAEGDILIPAPCGVTTSSLSGSEKNGIEEDHGGMRKVIEHQPSRRKHQHNRSLSDLFSDATKLSSVVTDSMNEEIDCNQSTGDPLSTFPFQQLNDSSMPSATVTTNKSFSGSKHRRVFSGGLSNPSLAHRRLDSIGASFFVDRNQDHADRGTSPTHYPIHMHRVDHSLSPSSPPRCSHRKLDSGGLDLLTIAAKASVDEQCRFDSRFIRSVTDDMGLARKPSSPQRRAVSAGPSRTREYSYDYYYHTDRQAYHPHYRSHYADHHTDMRSDSRDRQDRYFQRDMYPNDSYHHQHRAKSSRYPIQESSLGLDRRSSCDVFYDSYKRRDNFHEDMKHDMAAPPIRKPIVVPRSVNGPQQKQESRHSSRDSWTMINSISEPTFPRFSSESHKRSTTELIFNDLVSFEPKLEMALSRSSPYGMTEASSEPDSEKEVLRGPSMLSRSSSDDNICMGDRIIKGGTSKRIRRKCEIEGCQNRVVQGGKCIGHGAKRKICGYPGCSKHVKKAGMCSTHGPARKKCENADCDKVAVQGGRCIAHGAKKKLCSVEKCAKQAILFGMCKKHHDKAMTNPSLFEGQMCQPITSTYPSLGDNVGHRRGLSIFHDMNTVDTILSKAYSTGEYNIDSAESDKVNDFQLRDLSIFTEEAVGKVVTETQVSI